MVITAAGCFVIGAALSSVAHTTRMQVLAAFLLALSCLLLIAAVVQSVGGWG